MTTAERGCGALLPSNDARCRLSAGHYTGQAIDFDAYDAQPGDHWKPPPGWHHDPNAEGEHGLAWSDEAEGAVPAAASVARTRVRAHAQDLLDGIDAGRDRAVLRGLVTDLLAELDTAAIA